MSDVGPNRVGHDWLKKHRGKRIQISIGDYDWAGVLIRWDLYNVLLEVDYGPKQLEILIKQGPGMSFRAEEVCDG